ncbi:ATP-dependent helicase [Leucobacter sp. UCMA 4100]|uniref:UrvD/REP family ATP-dependent DNA helicase n=1 Tax=Leucobacter sp. UCMA 4100 TaxID=2810534 RepID=UPI0022EB45A7|nr:UrvD/REP family ATP-dependent DNA helicase [Leucobacter sp. UCMA 4100]MDA3146058.1 ATP-dependent helicase [Leucobacter sp. UCMA 4100]
MSATDHTILQVQHLSPKRHARVVGAPGSGKTTALVERVVSWLHEAAFTPEELLVLSHQRADAASLRDRIEAKLDIASVGTLVRTPASLAFQLCNEHQQRLALPAFQLMMGSRQDEILREAVDSVTEAAAMNDAGTEALAAESSGISFDMVQSTAMRTELRDLWRVLDDFSMSAAELETFALGVLAEPGHGEFVHELARRWRFLALLLARAERIAVSEYPEERSASAMMRDAVALLGEQTLSNNLLSVPKLVLVDDAADLSEGALALLAALANCGTRIWVFGDPDTATAAFAGEPTRVLAHLHRELERRGAHESAVRGEEQVLILGEVFRHDERLRGFVRGITERIGAAGGWQQRAAVSEAAHESSVECATASTFSEQAGVIAYRLRHRHLGLDPAQPPIAWHDMAVICRSSEQAKQLASTLESLQVPTSLASGGMVIGHVLLVRHTLRVLQDALGFVPLGGGELQGLLLGPIGGLDPLAIRRLDHAVLLADRRDAFVHEREPRTLAEAYSTLIESPDDIPDLAEGRALRRLSKVIHSARTVRAAGGTPREALWALWESTGLQASLSARALDGSGMASAQAHHQLDAMMELFFAFERHEELASDVPMNEVIDELLLSDVPQDSLARRSVRSAVTVTTPQGASSQEFEIVCIAGPQEGIWPNMRSRDSLVGAQALQTLLRGEAPQPFNRSHMLHEELRLFASACSRPRRELLIIAREDDDEFPSQFFHLGRPHLTSGLPAVTLTLRGYTAHLRRSLTGALARAEHAVADASNGDVFQEPNGGEEQHRIAPESAATVLAYLAREGVPGASPDEWYGVATPSTERPLVDLTDPEAHVSVSPSRIEMAETCPLNWFISVFAPGPGNTSAELGTLVHHAFETMSEPSELELRRIIDAEWNHLTFDAPWQETLFRENAYRMVTGLVDYLSDASAKGMDLVASEAGFSLMIGQAKLGGLADRIEHVPGADGHSLPRIVDLKTGASFPSQAEAENNAQLLSYQMGLVEAEFRLPDAAADAEGEPTTVSFGSSGGAALLFVHPKATTQKQAYRLVDQPALTPEKRAVFEERVQQVADIMAAGRFEAKVEHHCTDPHQFGACGLHIIPAVSYE